MINKVIDQSIREELLTPDQSFIVQAPAGSGKTELLTQRILALLAVVEKPENILAITFTRKAAAEMQSRVISALQLAQSSEPIIEHEKHRWRLARKVLLRDKEKNWRLLENPARLNMTTIDSLSASLSSALPLLSQTGALPKITENAQPYYQEAADNLLASVSDNDETARNIQYLLRHKDNNLNQVSDLIAKMLSKRLQWLAQITVHSRQYDHSQMMHSFEVIIAEKLQQVYARIPQNIVCELPELINQAAEVLSVNEKVKKPFLQSLEPLDKINYPAFSDLPIWKSIAELFLKSGKKAEILSNFNVGSGFPTDKDAIDDIEKIRFKKNKKMIKQIAADLTEIEGMADLLLQVKFLPENIDESIKSTGLQAAIALLPMAVAHLKLVFSRYNVIDFPELSLASLEALGHPEMPSDLALALDYRLDHILIDEFQDTSTPQIELIRLLTAAWEPGTARTLFLVGDPMQSIYRFRDANVSLFMQIRHQGVGDIPLHFRQLQVNFRSSRKIVEWVNQQFHRIMPENDDVTFSAVSYAPSVAFNHDDEKSSVAAIVTVDANDSTREAEKIIEIIEQHLSNNYKQRKNKTLAILARSRNHFKEIIRLLNQNGIDFEAVEIDRLSQKSVVKDLTTLAFALCDQYDELNWAACMRSPWFGLSLEAIRQVMVSTELTLPLPQRIQMAIPLMDETSQERCHKILAILNAVIMHKGKKPFRKWLYGCFIAIGGLAQLDFSSDLDDLLVCLDKLDELNDGGELNDREAVYLAIDRLFAASNPDADGQIQVMTIHKSKGLEFDSVILPRLDAGKPPPEQELLKWTEVLTESGVPHNLLAISKETGKESDSVYQYISYLDSQKSQYEDQRVLYVAATRAKEKLFLLANVKSDKQSDDGYKKPVSRSFLAMLWPGIKQDFCPIHLFESSEAIGATTNINHNLYQSRLIKRVNLEKILSVPESSCDAEVQPQALSGDREYVENLSEIASNTGNVLHRQLQWISENYNESFCLPDNWQQITRSQLQQNYHFSSEEELEVATLKVIRGVNNILDDEFGRLILSSNVESGCELMYHKKLEHGNFLTRIVDRTFVDNGIRWVIDYKSSQPEQGESLSDFIEREKALYFSQVSDYFKLFVKLENRPVIAGLYFPMIAHFEKMLEKSVDK